MCLHHRVKIVLIASIFATSAVFFVNAQTLENAVDPFYDVNNPPPTDYVTLPTDQNTVTPSGSSGIILPPAAGAQNPVPAAAGAQGPANSTFTLQNPLKVNSVSEVILTFMQIASYLAVLFGVLALVYVGLQFILARGNSERMKELSKWLLYIVIGIAIIIGARILIDVIINTLSATGTINPAIINSVHNAQSGL